jgi:hypothetical protein
MLFLSYHQLHHGPAAEAEAEAPREGGAGAGGFRFSFRNVFSSVVPTPSRRDRAPEVKRNVRHASGDQEEGQKGAGAGTALGSKFEEAVELSCWSS